MDERSSEEPGSNDTRVNCEDADSVTVKLCGKTFAAVDSARSSR